MKFSFNSLKRIYDNNKHLGITLAVCLLSGNVLIPSVHAEDIKFDVGTSGIYDTDRDIFNKDAIIVSKGKGSNDVNYHFEDGTHIDVDVSCITMPPLTSGAAHDEITIGDGTGTMYLHAKGPNYLGVSGVYVSDGDNLHIIGNLDIRSHSEDWSAQGITMFRAGTGVGRKTDVVVDGNVFIGDRNNMNPTEDSSNYSAGWGVNAVDVHAGGDSGGNIVTGYKGARWQPLGFSVGMSNGSGICVNGDVYMTVRGTGLTTDPYYPVLGMDDYDVSMINLNKGNITIITPNSTKDTFYSIANYGGTINVNMAEEDVDKHDILIKGNMFCIKCDTDPDLWGTTGGDSGKPYFYRSGRVNVALANDKSRWIGIIDNCGEEFSGEINLWLQNDAVWEHKTYSKRNGMDLANMPKPSNEGHYDNYDWRSRVNVFTGGKDREHAGNIIAKDDSRIRIKDYCGYTDVYYGHTGDGSKRSDYMADEVVIERAREGSVITFITGSNGVDLTSEKAIIATLNGLATRFIYKSVEPYFLEELDEKSSETLKKADSKSDAADVDKKEEKIVYKPENLLAVAKIAEGITTPEITVTDKGAGRYGKIKYTADGKSYVDAVSDEAEVYKDSSELKNLPLPKVPELKPIVNPDTGTEDAGSSTIYNNNETAMMRGARCAMSTSILGALSQMTEKSDRMGNLRMETPNGIWARVYGGKAKYEKDNATFSNKYKSMQVGTDMQLRNGWHIGTSFDYTDGDASYELGGSGDPKMYMISGYATKELKNNQYLDLTAKIGRAENEYTVYNDSRYKLTGDYHTNCTAFSIEYGKRFGNEKAFIEPQLQYTVARVEGTDYTAHSDYDIAPGPRESLSYDNGRDVEVSQDGITARVVRVGLLAGTRSDSSTFYAKLGVLHNMSGDANSFFATEGEFPGKVTQSFDDTWVELGLGGTYKLSKATSLYADVKRTFGGDYEEEWNLNAGLRYNF